MTTRPPAAREYADPPVPSARPSMERLRAGRQARRRMPVSDAFLIPGVPGDEPTAVVGALMSTPRSDIDVLLAVDTAVAPCRDGREVALDLVDVDQALPGPFEIDLLLATGSLVGLAHVLPRRSERRNLLCDVGMSLGFGYAEGVGNMTQLPQHAGRAGARAIARSAHASLPGRLRRQVPRDAADAADRVVADSIPRRLRRGRLSRLCGDDVTDPPRGADREVAQYRDTLADDDARVLAGYQLADLAALPSAAGGDLVALLVGGAVGDVLVLHGRAVATSPLEGALGAWRLGSDVQRVLQARSAMRLVPEEFLGWSTSPDGRTGRVWSRWRGRPDVPVPRRPADIRSWAHARGVILGLAHGLTGDPFVLSGYVGRRGSSLAKALGRVMAAQA